MTILWSVSLPKARPGYISRKHVLHIPNTQKLASANETFPDGLRIF